MFVCASEPCGRVAGAVSSDAVVEGSFAASAQTGQVTVPVQEDRSCTAGPVQPQRVVPLAPGAAPAAACLGNPKRDRPRYRLELHGRPSNLSFAAGALLGLFRLTAGPDISLVAVAVCLGFAAGCAEGGHSMVTGEACELEF